MASNMEFKGNGVKIYGLVGDGVLGVKVVNKSNNTLPEYKTKSSAGMDIRASLEDGPIILLPMERALISTGLFIEIPDGYEGQLRARSGLSIKHGITLINALGTIDADFRGEVKVPLVNLSRDPFVISHGDRIAQIVFAKHETAVWIETDLEETERGEGGFGSTGVR